MTDSTSNGDGSAPQRRRMSIADMFSARPALSSSPPSAGTPATPEAGQHRRGVSISTLGLAGSGNTQTSPFTAFARQRRASIATSSAASSPEFKNSFSDEHAVIEEDEPIRGSYGSPPSPSFARRMSFGAHALKDVRQGGAAAGTGASNGGEGFNWSEALRDRTKRSPSFSSGNPFAANVNRTRSAVTAPAPEPPREMPKSPPPSAKLKKPDYLGERMLRGDFMMD